MKLTPEQELIINSTGNIRINAVAGSGKTTTVIEYARSRPATAKILYLAFNRSVKLEAEKKFKDKGLNNVTIETAHSLAYKYVVTHSNYKIKSGYKTYEIAELLGLQGDGQKHAEYIIANHINKFIAYFCNSDKQKVQELNYLDIVFDAKAKAFVTRFYTYIEKQTRLLLAKMDKGEIEITHDFYLKKFQLSQHKLNYDFILFDEGQDASAAMLDVFLNQSATKVIVGDTHQQIYGWRHAVNSLEKVDFKTFHLSTSFRFSQDIANLACEVLDWKKHLKAYEPVTITGKGTTKTFKTKAVIARTNLGLLLQAIHYATEKKKIKKIYFEGNIQSYTYAEEGASLYDVLNLSNGKHTLIRDKLIRSMKNIAELEEYIESTDDAQLSTMIDIVKKYGNDIYSIIKEIKAKHVGDDEKDKAEIIFSTVHRCKGMEYDAIELANDFLTEEKLIRFKKEAKEDGAKAKLNEEINLLYVALTRTKNSIHIPEALLPKDFPASPYIYIVRAEAEKEVDIKPAKFKKSTAVSAKEKPYVVDSESQSRKGTYTPWTDAQDAKLSEFFSRGDSLEQMADYFGRTRSAVGSRIKKLSLEDGY
jgi:F-box protein 18 (helicase)